MKIIGLIICLLVTAPLQAQDYDKVAQATCDCISQKDLSGMELNVLQAELGICLIEAAKNGGVEMDFSNPDAMRGLGEQIGMKMAGLCLDKLLAFTGKGPQTSEVKVQLEGKVKSVDVGDFVFLVVKESSGRESKLLWLRYFEGSDSYVENPKKLSGKDVIVEYKEIECFVPKAGAYFKQKEITSLQVK
jgi:hypothetical protein